ncbi:MAG: GGDEF domain-containing protein [Actinobacteria bacterium]|nr:GGDEF domain-containing protein [Actinomycetota bacterium]
MAPAPPSGPDDLAPLARPSAHGDAPSLTRRVASAPLWVRIVSCLLLLGLIALLDNLSGEEISFSVFYLLPVLLAGTFISRNAGRVAALAGAVTWGYSEVAARPYSAAWIPVWNSAVRLIFFLAINELVHSVRTAHERERTLSRTDSLTGIANGRVFAERVRQEIAKSDRDGRPFTIAYADLDRFKQVNDTYGHSEGDRLLRAVAETISRELRAVDLVARLGGDEFGLLLTATDADGARVTLARIAQALGREAGERWGVGATFGAVTFVEPPADADMAVRTADDLMYRGKSQERGTILDMTWPARSVEVE